ncbi:MAG TPA: DedA family protein [Candidatus Limnocylindrales bacterium]|nr:DedA family protein [Candidatus Limnocylindrales bacterium]
MLAAVFDFLDGPVRQLVTEVYGAVGYVGVAIWVAIESVVIPIPSEIVLPFAGFLVGEGRAIEPLTGAPWQFWPTVMAGTLGAVLGALVAYAIGALGGRPALERWGRLLGVKPEDLERTEAFFARYGNAAAFFGRMVPVVRSLVSFAAGIGRMPLLPFVVFTALGSLPWTLLLVFAGMELGANWAAIGPILKRFELAVLVALAIAAALFVWFRIVGPRLARRPSAG